MRPRWGWAGLLVLFAVTLARAQEEDQEDEEEALVEDSMKAEKEDSVPDANVSFQVSAAAFPSCALNMWCH